MSVIEKKLDELGLQLPSAPNPVANYVSVQKVGKVLYFSGAGPFEDGKPVMFGKLGRDVTLEQGYQAAKLAALNLISVMRRELGDLDQVKQIVKLLGFVASDPEFTQQPAVINGASDLFVEVFRDKGKHARSAVAAPVLPMNIPVEIELIIEIH